MDDPLYQRLRDAAIHSINDPRAGFGLVFPPLRDRSFNALKSKVDREHLIREGKHHTQGMVMIALQGDVEAGEAPSQGFHQVSTNEPSTKHDPSNALLRHSAV